MSEIRILTHEKLFRLRILWLKDHQNNHGGTNFSFSLRRTANQKRVMIWNKCEKIFWS